MCGIAGVFALDGSSVGKNKIATMASGLRHRGPDDEGYVFIDTGSGGHLVAGGEDTPDEAYLSNLPYAPQAALGDVCVGTSNLGLAHRRLAILDPSVAGHQPMCNETRSMWIVHNGEVYNYAEIREELRSTGQVFRSNTDTEVVLKAYEAWGSDCLKRFNGMWAFCIWDSLRQELFCARDRLGIKPFYYYYDGLTFAFASEIKALLGTVLTCVPDDAAISDFLRYGILDHTDGTFFKNVKKLSPAHFMIVRLGGRLAAHRYWDFAVSNEMEEQEGRDDEYARDVLDLLVDSVRIRLRSDVPVGSCLSGGLDSSSIVVIANELMCPFNKELASARQKTFSACCDDRRLDERSYIETIINKTQAERNYVFPGPEGFLRELDTLLWHQEEPFGGTGIYAQWEVMKSVRDRGVKVVLDGQGGDEQLAGYRKFYIFFFRELMKRRELWRLLAEAVKFFSSPGIVRTLNVRSGLRYFAVGNKLQSVDSLLSEPFRTQSDGGPPGIGCQEGVGCRMKADLTKFSLPVLLRYEDKNSMASAVEARLPFLDYRIVEKLASLPLDQKMRGGWTKYVLRSAMKGRLPEEVRLRKSKLGFATPEDEWLRHAIRDDVMKRFKEPVFISEYADVRRLTDRFDRYLSGVSNINSSVFFRFYILELWGRRFAL